MHLPQFIFTKFKSSFSVKIPNLEELSVEQIRLIESFVNERRGLFDFDTYSFVIQKKIEFEEFLALLKSCKIDANCKEEFQKTFISKKIDFGKYKGMQFSDVPDVYLQWLKINYFGPQKDLIDQELNNRGI